MVSHFEHRRLPQFRPDRRPLQHLLLASRSRITGKQKYCISITQLKNQGLVVPVLRRRLSLIRIRVLIFTAPLSSSPFKPLMWSLSQWLTAA